MNEHVGGVFLLGSCFEIGGGIREDQKEPWQAEREATQGWESFHISESDPNYPSKKDAKAMRNEIVASVVALKRLVKRLRLNPDDLRNTPLYIATSIPAHSLEEEIGRLLKSVDIPRVWEDQEVRNRLLFSMTNPLTGLKVLSNANSCFASENCGARGNNATFGDTSVAGFQALEEAWFDISEGRSTYAIVGVGASCGRASQLSLRGLAGPAKLQKETEAAVFLVLGNKMGMETIGVHAPIRIKHLEQMPSIPDILEQADEHSCFESEDDSDTFNVYSDPLGYFPETGADQLNLSYDIGNLGAASLLCSIALAQDHLATRKYAAAVCRDKDVYGRETRVDLEVCS
ncbi:MAG: hypothetical protein EX260_08935 [Desulfobulbaceae bacterium]|nr:MAG: hypothetical protein EX260_08935 [Desulfobulbaceae bacterium]